MPRKQSVRSLVELGIGNLGTQPSLNAWADFFTDADIYGVDDGKYSRKRYKPPSRANIHVVLADMDGEEILSRPGSRGLPERDIDVLIDDASHKVTQQIRNLEAWFPRVRDGGLYIIEDLFVYDHEHSLGMKLDAADIVPNTNRCIEGHGCFMPQRPAEHPLLDVNKMPPSVRGIVAQRHWFWTITAVNPDGGLHCMMAIVK